MQLTKKLFTAVLITIMLITAIPFFGEWVSLVHSADAATTATEYALFPMDVIDITRTNTKIDADQLDVADPDGGHVWYAWDLKGSDTTVVAPFTGKIIYKDNAGNHSVILESVDKVKLANGTEDYVVCMFTHDDKLNSNVKVGDVIKQGEYFYDQGTYGNGKTGTYGKHLHFEAAVGKMTSANKKSFSTMLNYMRSKNGRQVYEIFHLTPSTSRVKDYVKVVCQNNKIIKFNWKNVCYLTFNVNGGSAIQKGVFLQNTTVDLSSYSPTKAFYNFAGWFKEAELTTSLTSIKLSNHATIYAKWEVSEYPVRLYYNYSGKNYFKNSDFSVFDTSLYSSRDTSVYTVSGAEGRSDSYGSMKIVGTAAGTTGKDLLWRSSTMGNVSSNGYVGDNKSLTLSFWAKSSVDNVKFYVRYGYQTEFQSVTLTTSWKYYTIRLDKDTTCGHDLHPYFDKAGTFYISELQLEDGTEATEFAPENMGYETVTYSPNETYTNLPVPTRDGYVFDGWYTSATGGEKITDSTAVMSGALNLYAHWKKHVHIIGTIAAVKPTCATSGLTEGKYCTECNEVIVAQQNVPANSNSHKYTNVVDNSCNVCGNVRNVNYTGWVLSSGKWYYYEGGNMVSNCWRKDSKGWVFLSKNGAMLTNSWCRDSKGWCYVGNDGYAVTNCWKKDSIGWIWLDSEGSMTKSTWIMYNGNWYYLNSSGYMVSNAWCRDSKGWVYLGSDGAMLRNSWCRDSKGWCYVGNDGYAVTNCWMKDSIGWIWLDNEGSMTKNQWIYYDGAWYYLNHDGYLV